MENKEEEEVESEEIISSNPNFPGVLVLRVPGPTPGEEKLEISPLGGLDILAIPTLLEFAQRVAKQNLGLS